MTKSVILGAVSMLAVSSAAMAGEPVRLGDAQMDGVTAGAFRLALNLNAVLLNAAIGNSSVTTSTESSNTAATDDTDIAVTPTSITDKSKLSSGTSTVKASALATGTGSNAGQAFVFGGAAAVSF